MPSLGPLAPRGAVGARHDGLPRQFSPLLPVVCDGLSLSEGFAFKNTHHQLKNIQEYLNTIFKFKNISEHLGSVRMSPGHTLRLY